MCSRAVSASALQPAMGWQHMAERDGRTIQYRKPQHFNADHTREALNTRLDERIFIGKSESCPV